MKKPGWLARYEIFWYQGWDYGARFICPKCAKKLDRSDEGKTLRAPKGSEDKKTWKQSKWLPTPQWFKEEYSFTVDVGHYGCSKCSATFAPGFEELT